MPPAVARLVSEGRIGGRTVRIAGTGEVGCEQYPVSPVAEDKVLIRTVRSAISPGTEMTFLGREATNVYLHKTWDESLRLFVPGTPSTNYPITFGYRAAGVVVESRDGRLREGTRVFGNWRHTEFTQLSVTDALAQTLPEALSWDDGVDVAQMGPICLNAVAFSEREHIDAPVVVFGAGPVGLIVAQVARADGAGSVHVVDRIPERLAIAARLGLEPIEATPDTDVAVTLKRRFGANGVPVAFECTGSARALHEAIRTVRRRGTVVAVGFYQGEASGLFLGDEFHHNGISVRCGQIGNLHPDWSWPALRARTMELVINGHVVLGDLPRTAMPVEAVADGFMLLRRPSDVLQVVLTYDEERPSGA